MCRLGSRKSSVQTEFYRIKYPPNNTENYFGESSPMSFFVLFYVVPTVNFARDRPKMLQFVVGSSVFKRLHTIFNPYVDLFLLTYSHCTPISVYRHPFHTQKSAGVQQSFTCENTSKFITSTLILCILLLCILIHYYVSVHGSEINISHASGESSMQAIVLPLKREFFWIVHKIHRTFGGFF